MPVTKSAKKKLRQDKKRTLVNQKTQNALKKAIKIVQKKKAGDLGVLFSMIDKSVKNNFMHKNKAARLKSSLAKTVKNTAKVGVKTNIKPSAKTVSKTVTKPVSKPKTKSAPKKTTAKK